MTLTKRYYTSATKPFGARLRFPILLPFEKKGQVLRRFLCTLFECIQPPGDKTEFSLHCAGISPVLQDLPTPPPPPAPRQSTLQNHSTTESHQQLKEKELRTLLYLNQLLFFPSCFSLLTVVLRTEPGALQCQANPLLLAKSQEIILRVLGIIMLTQQ